MKHLSFQETVHILTCVAPESKKKINGKQVCPNWLSIPQQGQVRHMNNHATLLRLTSLPDDKILDWSKLKQIADDIWIILKCI